MEKTLDSKFVLTKTGIQIATQCAELQHGNYGHPRAATSVGVHNPDRTTCKSEEQLLVHCTISCDAISGPRKKKSPVKESNNSVKSFSGGGNENFERALWEVQTQYVVEEEAAEEGWSNPERRRN